MDKMNVTVSMMCLVFRIPIMVPSVGGNTCFVLLSCFCGLQSLWCKFATPSYAFAMPQYTCTVHQSKRNF